jgi:hypothetical protein
MKGDLDMVSKNTSLFALAAVLALGVTGVPAAAQADYGDATVYNTYDNNNDGQLTEDEWVAYSYSVIDVNNDNFVDQEEWDYYNTVWYDPYDLDTNYVYTDYDANNDGYITITEYSDSYDEELFSAWDADNDNMINEDEYDTVVGYYGESDQQGVFDW